jgi:hypothetical protein
MLNLELAGENVAKGLKSKEVMLTLSVRLTLMKITLVRGVIYDALQMKSHVSVQLKLGFWLLI